MAFVTVVDLTRFDMGRGDVICLQQGERGCYTASHWWNLHVRVTAWTDVGRDCVFSSVQLTHTVKPGRVQGCRRTQRRRGI